MESLTEVLSEREDQISQTEQTRHRAVKTPDRVTLGIAEGQRVEQWLSQVNDSSKGFLNLTKSDLINFLIRHRKDALGPKELSQIRSDHYDPVRHIAWIAPQIKAAIAARDTKRVSDLQAELRSVELSVGTDAEAGGLVASGSDDSTQAAPKKEKAKTRRAKVAASENMNVSESASEDGVSVKHF